MSNLHKSTNDSRLSKARPIHGFFSVLIAAAFTTSCLAAPDIRSTKNEFSDNPFMALGVNPATQVVTGYFSALLTAPGKTDACKFTFRGTLTPGGEVRLSIKDALRDDPGSATSGSKEYAVLTATKDAIKLDLPRSLAPGDCDWVLESVGGPNISTDARGFDLSVSTGPKADWIGVATIRSKRAFFHNTPHAATVRKAFLVTGDVAYVMEERPGWYRVKFTHALKDTVGWIRTSDTVQ